MGDTTGAEHAPDAKDGTGKPNQDGTGKRKPNQSTTPRWARWCTVLGAVLMVLSGGALVGFEAVMARYAGAVEEGDLFEPDGTPVKRKDIKGPLNILLVGVDPRKPEDRPLADSIMVVHVNETLDQAYVFSMPRDLIVEIPAFPPAGYGGGTGKLNGAMSFGSAVQGNNPSTEQGFQLLSKTLVGVLGIEQFDAGAIINFGGFQKIVDAMGGVDMYIEREVRSRHRKPDGTHRDPNPNGEGYVGPQAVYPKGTMHLNGWQALDYVRQRYESSGVPDGDYGRQRHQQQFLKAMAAKATSSEVLTDLPKLDAVLRAAGKSLVFNGRGNSVPDFAFALRNLRPESIHLIKLPGRGVGTGRGYRGEEFEPVAQEFLAALRSRTAAEFLVAHPELINKDQ